MALSETIDATPAAAPASAAVRLACAHCGARCPDDRIRLEQHAFCCHGCLTVFQLLAANGLDRFYTLEQTPGVRMNQQPVGDGRFAYLDDAAIQARLLDFTNGSLSRVTFHIPAIHCLACIWLLENLFRLNAGIGAAQVNFPRKELALSFDPRALSLRGVVELLSSLGYEPTLNLGAGSAPRSRLREERSLWLKIGLAGFVSANSMMLNLSHYYGLEAGDSVGRLNGWVNFGLAIPVLLYSASDYFRQSWLGLRRRALTLDVPIALGALALFAQSAYDVITATGEGYFDSFTGLIFLLLCGRWFQQRSFDALSFDRDYRSYFPLAVRRREPTGDRSIPISDLRVGDHMVVRHQEIVPADSRLISPEAHLDYSFVTGEAEPVVRHAGDVIYAGGRQVGPAVELEALKETSQSYLASLWNHEAFRKNRAQTLDTVTNRMSRWFTALVLLLATASACLWLNSDPARAAQAFVATLIVACPCALALSAPFALGFAQRQLARARCFLKNSETVEHLARMDTLVFDKTGTLTRSGEVAYDGAPLPPDVQRAVRAVAAHSTHPLSRSIAGNADDVWPEVLGFHEEPGLGLRGNAAGHEILIGSSAWLRQNQVADLPATVHGTAIAVQGHYRGAYHAVPAYRTNVEHFAARLSPDYRLAVLSGDGDGEAARLRAWFGPRADLRFQQQPLDKLEAVRLRQQAGARVLMLGDGLNDAGALRQADLGVAVTDDLAAFTPACDAILDARQLDQLPAILHYARKTVSVIHLSFAVSLLYNAVGLWYAMRGELSPLICAVLMPISSVSVVALALGGTRWAAHSSGLRLHEEGVRA
jgi:Cu+-exporting ATPase